ncbi:MAG: CHAT domain-containing protein [candidate division Zixibacteria bacterium]|nr:CHAT domain-containing protein [candidate division Zixibacteria bacterium]
MSEIQKIPKFRTAEEFRAFLNESFEGDPGRLLKAINTSVNNYLRSDLVKADDYLKKASGLKKFFPPAYRPQLEAIEARIEHWKGNSIRARSLYLKAIDKMVAAREFEQAAKTRLGLLDVHMYLGEYDRAFRTGRKALRYFHSKKNQNLIARLLTNLGNIYHRQDRNRMALRYYDRARKIFMNVGGPALALVEFNRANICMNLNRLDEAEKLYEEAAEIFSEHNQQLAVAKARYSLAYVYFLREKFSHSLRLFEQVYSEFKRLGDEKSADVTLLDMAEIDIDLNQYTNAVTQAEQVIERFDRTGMKYEKAKASFFAGKALMKTGDYKPARNRLRTAERLFEKQANYLWQGIAKMQLSRLELAENKFVRSHNTADKARKLFVRADDNRRIVDAEIMLTEIMFRSGKSNPACGKATALLKKNLLEYQKHILNKLLGEHFLQREDYSQALRYFRKAIAQTEKSLVGMYPDEIRFFYTLDKYDVYLNSVECLLKLGRTRQSFLQQSRALSLINLRNISPARLKKQVPEKYLVERDRLRSRLKQLMTPPSADRRAVGDSRELRKIDRGLWRNERAIRSFLYPSKNDAESKSGSDFDPHKYLRSNEVLISYLLVGNDVGAFCVRRDSTRFVDCGISRKAFNSILRELHFLCEKSVHYPLGDSGPVRVMNHFLHVLNEHLVEKMQLDSGIDRLLIMADGIFGQVPFSALTDEDGRSLWQRYSLVNLVNPDDLASRGKKLSSARLGRSAVFTARAESLPMAQLEGEIIHKAFPTSKTYTGERATLFNLKHELKRSKGFVHIASHASRDSENPLFSRILFGDGPFFPFDLFGVEINSELVCLSGCQTAAPGLNYGGSFSLARAFYQAGARYVLASLWPLSDKISMMFMKEFYTALSNEPDIHRAYYRALDKINSINSNPAFWSPFVLLGV